MISALKWSKVSVINIFLNWFSTNCQWVSVKISSIILLCIFGEGPLLWLLAIVTLQNPRGFDLMVTVGHTDKGTNCMSPL